MHDTYWVGYRQSDIYGLEHKMAGSITIFGENNVKNNFSPDGETRKNHNFLPLEHDLYLENKIGELMIQNNSSRFMFYNPAVAYRYKNIDLKRVICLNSKNNYDLFNDKIEVQRRVKDDVPVLDSVVVSGRDYNYEKLSSFFRTNNLIVQTQKGSGGFGTNLVKNNYFVCDVQKEYLVTAYQANAISYCVHTIIYEDEVKIFVPSIQIIKEIEGKMIYCGNDFVVYQNISSNIQNKLIDYTRKVAKIMQAEGYLGIAGIDFISVDEDLYFIEINPRFQASSFLLNIALLEKDYPSLQELNFEAFYQPKSKYTIPFFEVNYSYLAINKKRESNYYDTLIKKLPEDVKVILDGYKEGLQLEDKTYLYKVIFKKRLCEADVNLM